MPSTAPTSLRDILPLVTERLASTTGVSANRVLLLQRPDTPKFQGDSDVLVRVGPPSPDQGYSLGAGRTAVVIHRPLQVTARVRAAFDQSDRDDTALLSSAGLLALEESLVDALHVWVPTSGDDWLTVEPIHWVPGGQILHDTPLHQSWLHSDLMFSLRYQLRVSSNGF